MPRSWLLAVATAGIVGALIAVPAPTPAQEKKADDKDIKKRVEESVEKGLEWLKKTQAQDGHWEAHGGQYPTSMTALAGMAFLMEGSTLKEGKYTDQIPKAVNWFLAPARQQANGLLGNSENPTESTRYMYGHGFGTMFLASVYGEEEDKEQRKKLEKVLKKAVEFIGKAQTSKKHRKAEGKEVESAAGATSARPTAATSTKARSRSRSCRLCGPPATPASWCRRRPSTRRPTTSRPARRPRAA